MGICVESGGGERCLRALKGRGSIVIEKEEEEEGAGAEIERVFNARER